VQPRVLGSQAVYLERKNVSASEKRMEKGENERVMKVKKTP
jgi:hypothetical protein